MLEYGPPAVPGRHTRAERLHDVIAYFAPNATVHSRWDRKALRTSGYGAVDSLVLSSD